ncbi:hypothetical protein N7486_008409 [Penicillium sp. IBT 16267x]|nr:hypothetical protein N7486_008409 [Penicillium sp. IBT 16267x]
MRTISSSAVPTPEGEGDGRNFWGLVDLSSGFSAQAEKRKANRDASRRFRNRQHEELLRYRKRRVIDLEERLTAQQDEIQGHVETIRRQSEKIRSLVQQRDNYRAELDLYHDRFGSLSKLPPRSPSLYSLPSCLLPMAEKNVAVSSTKPADESPKQLGHTGPISGRSHCFLFSQLPTRSRKSEAFIPINKDGERLDPWYQWYDPPSLDAFSEYHGRVMVDKLCNSWHLSGECGDTSCEYDHSDASDTIIDVLRYTLLRDPCPKARECRSSKCYFGHICQKPYCKAAESRQCRFNYRAHTMDLQVHQWVAPVENPDAQHELISGFSLGSTPGTDQTAAKIEKPQNTI